jgi:hypothetical protein
MSEPTRFIGSGGLKGKLLASAKEDRPPKGSRHRALLAAATAAAAGTKAASATATVSATLGRWAMWKWIAVSAIGAGTVVAAKAVILPPQAEATSTTAPQAAPASVPALRSRRDSSPASKLPSDSASAEVLSPLPAPLPLASPTDLAKPPKVDEAVAVVASAPPVRQAAAPARETPKAETPATPPAPSSTLASEIAAIDHAKRALASGSAGEALRRVDAYRAAFPSGTLAAEEAAIRVEALARVGRHDEALAELARLRASHPDSPLLENLTQIVAE